jgi:hypothetical protein
MDSSSTQAAKLADRPVAISFTVQTGLLLFRLTLNGYDKAKETGRSDRLPPHILGNQYRVR